MASSIGSINIPGSFDPPIYANGAGPSVNLFNHPTPPASDKYPFVGHKYVGDLPGYIYDPYGDKYYPDPKTYAKYTQNSGLLGPQQSIFQQLLPSLLGAVGIKGASALGSSLFGGGGKDSSGGFESWLSNKILGGGDTGAASAAGVPNFNIGDAVGNNYPSFDLGSSLGNSSPDFSSIASSGDSIDAASSGFDNFLSSMLR